MRHGVVEMFANVMRNTAPVISGESSMSPTMRAADSERQPYARGWLVCQLAGVADRNTRQSGVVDTGDFHEGSERDGWHCCGARRLAACQERRPGKLRTRHMRHS